MTSDVVIALVAGASSIIGSSVGAFATSKLTNYRLEELEKTVHEIVKKNDDVIILKEQMKGVIEDVQELKKR